MPGRTDKIAVVSLMAKIRTRDPPPVYEVLTPQQRCSVVYCEAEVLTASSSGDICRVRLQKRFAALQVDPQLEGSRTLTNSACLPDHTASQPRRPCDVVNCCYCQSVLSAKPATACNGKAAWSSRKNFTHTVMRSCAVVANGYQM